MDNNIALADVECRQIVRFCEVLLEVGTHPYGDRVRTIADAYGERLLGDGDRVDLGIGVVIEVRLCNDDGTFTGETVMEPEEVDPDEVAALIYHRAGCLLDELLWSPNSRVWTLDGGETVTVEPLTEDGTVLPPDSMQEREWERSRVRHEVGEDDDLFREYENLVEKHTYDRPQVRDEALAAFERKRADALVERARLAEHVATQYRFASDPGGVLTEDERDAWNTWLLEHRPDLALAAQNSWYPADLDDVLDGTFEPQVPTILRRSDGPAFLYPGRIHSVNAEPEAGKGWLSCAACADVMLAGGVALYIDLEDSRENVVGRLVALGVPREVIRDRFRYVQPEERADEAAIKRLVALEPALVVIDSANEAMTLQGLNYIKNDEIVEFVRLMARPFKNAGAAVLLLDHVTKDKETRGRYAIGGQQKLAAVDVTYSLDVKSQFSRGHDGRVRVNVAKDRPAGVRPHAVGSGVIQHVAEMMLISHEDGSVSVRLDPPAGTLASLFERPEEEMEAVSAYLDTDVGRVANSKRAIESAVPHKADKVRTAIDTLVALGFVEQSPGPRNSQLHRNLKPYRSGDTT
jgi:hypothetical protein